jgi:hypothetical protein
MPFDIGVDVAIEIEKIRQDQTKGLVAEERGMGILECDGRDQHFPTAVSIAPPDLATLHLLEDTLRPRDLTPRAQHQLPQLFLAQSEMQSKSQHQKRADGLGGWPRIELLIRHQPNDFFSDLPVLSDRAFRLKHGHDGFERIAVDSCDPLDFLHPL